MQRTVAALRARYSASSHGGRCSIRAAISVPAVQNQQRAMAATAIRGADLVQELYLRELKNYKPKPVSSEEMAEQTRKFTTPKAPAIPAVEGSGSDDVEAYAAAEVEVGAEEAEEAATFADEGGDLFEPEPEEEEAAGHH